MAYRLFILFFLFFLNLSAVTIDTAVNKVDNFQIEHYYDAKAVLDIKNISQLNFNKTSNSQFTFGYLNGNRWFKIKIKNQSQNENFVLYFTEPLWQQFDLYTNDKGIWNISHAGLLTPLNQREISDVNPAFTIHIPKNSEKVVYVCGNTVSGQIGEFEIYTQKYYYSPARLSITDKYLLYSSTLMIIFLLNLYLFIKRREAIYAYYLGYIFSFTIWISTVSALYLLFGLAPWNEALHATGAIFILFLVLFSAEYFELKERYEKMYITFHIFALMFFIFAVLITMKTPYASPIFNIVSSIFFTLLLIMSIKVYLEGHLTMRYYLIAMFFYMPTVTLMTLNFNNIIENNELTRYAYVYGSMIEVLFFNSLMINRYHLAVQEANIDPVSKLYNRRYLLKNTKKIFANAKRNDQELCVIMIDIDDFKSINDTYGHLMGDEAIKFCALTLSHLFSSAEIVAHYGNEEFIIITKHLQEKDALNIAKRVREYIDNNILYSKQDEKVHFTVSLGISRLEEADEDIGIIIDRASHALYTAKRNGKNQVITFEDISKNSSEIAL